MKDLRTRCELTCRCAECQLVAECAQAGDDTDRDVREIRVLPKRLTGVNVRQMHLDERQFHCCDGIPQRHTGMRERSGIENQKGDAVSRRAMDTVDELMLRVTLECA